MAKVTVPRQQITDGTLPSLCVVCGADAPNRLFPNIGAPSIAWVFLSPAAGLLTFWTYILFAGGSASGGLPFCDRHRGYWTRRARFIVIGLVAIVVLMVVGGILTTPAPPGKQTEPHWVFAIGAVGLLLYLPTFLIVHLAAMRPTGGNRNALVLSGASRQFADSVQVENGSA